MAQWNAGLSLSAEQTMALALQYARALGARAEDRDDILLRRMVDFTLGEVLDPDELAADRARTERAE